MHHPNAQLGACPRGWAVKWQYPTGGVTASLWPRTNYFHALGRGSRPVVCERSVVGHGLLDDRTLVRGDGRYESAPRVDATPSNPRTSVAATVTSYAERRRTATRRTPRRPRAEAGRQQDPACPGRMSGGASALLTGLGAMPRQREDIVNEVLERGVDRTQPFRPRRCREGRWKIVEEQWLYRTGSVARRRRGRARGLVRHLARSRPTRRAAIRRAYSPDGRPLNETSTALARAVTISCRPARARGHPDRTRVRMDTIGSGPRSTRPARLAHHGRG